MTTLQLRSFLESAPFREYLEQCWDESHYRSFPLQEQRGGCCPTTNAHILMYLVYATLLRLRDIPSQRVRTLALWLSAEVTEHGLLREDDKLTDHPACCSQVADALACAAYYANECGISGEDRNVILVAFRRVLEQNHRIRFPEGTQGKTQQLRFELRVYYWAWQLSGDAEDRERFLLALNNGIHRYAHPAAIDGPLLQPSLQPDWTWNYICTGGLTREHATNTHTPAYYCTEPNGFLFVLLRAWRKGELAADPLQEEFCRNYIIGLFRNLSRAGHLSSDLDGYGIHRAWFGPVLIEGIPLEAAAAAQHLGLGDEISAWLRWYAQRYLEFVQQQAGFAQTGFPDAQPYGHQIGIEAQFMRLSGMRFYASLARALAEFPQAQALPCSEPPALLSYAPAAQWLRVSTPEYETSFAGYTCLRNIPVVKNYGDPHLGTLIGGSPLTTLICGKELMAAASFPTASLWHMEVDDHNGRRLLSCSTGPQDEFSMNVRTPGGGVLDELSADPYVRPHLESLRPGDWTGLNWLRKERTFHCDFYVHNRYFTDAIELDWGMRGMAGHYYDRITFVLPLPQTATEVCRDGQWSPLHAGETVDAPEAVRWRRGSRLCEVTLALSSDAEGAQPIRWITEALPATDGNPGGRNNVSPFALMQLRCEISPATTARLWRMRNRMRFLTCPLS